MLKVYENYPLKDLNTFGIDVKAKYFIVLKGIECVRKFLTSSQFKDKRKFILGGGSNVLFTHDFNGVVLKPDITGIKILRDGKLTVTIKVGAGENWDGFVDFCVKNNMGGIENLSNIPGSVGSSPIQNIGAYGMEVKNVIKEVEGIRLDTLQKDIIKVDECNFEYRNSIFKNELKDKYLITSVTFKLAKKPRYITHYGSLNEELERLGETNLKNIRQAVITIRNRKLPDPDKIGNAGSFFKNPSIDEDSYRAISSKHNEVPAFRDVNNKWKLPAAWLIEKCNYKGIKKGKTGTYEHQPLVLINYGGASGKEIWNFASEIQEAVYSKFGVTIEPEVNVL